MSDENCGYFARVSPFDSTASTRLQEAKPALRVVPNDDSVAMVLRRERLLRMRDLSDIAAQLNIRDSYLQAIEDGSFEDLPNVTYATGFVKAYADLLGLDSAAIADRFRAEMGEVRTEPQSGLAVETLPVRISSAAILLLVILLVAMAYTG